MTQDLSHHLRKSLQYGIGASATEAAWLKRHARQYECDNCHVSSLGRMSHLFWQGQPVRICRPCLGRLVQELRAGVASGRNADDVRAEIFGRLLAPVEPEQLKLL